MYMKTWNKLVISVRSSIRCTWCDMVLLSKRNRSIYQDEMRTHETHFTPITELIRYTLCNSHLVRKSVSGIY